MNINVRQLGIGFQRLYKRAIDYFAFWYESYRESIGYACAKLYEKANVQV
ncbi:hypothetical protein [Peribacillus frigoritolerans]|nr:hypothetical protein [Peribacillus frigoritolerans]